jgi:hypothetical protein
MRPIRFLHIVAALFLCVTAGGADGGCISSGTVSPDDTSPANMEVEIEADDAEDPEDGEVKNHALDKISRHIIIPSRKHPGDRLRRRARLVIAVITATAVAIGVVRNAGPHA